MKMISALVISFLLSFASEWKTDFASAKQEATQSHKYILLNFSGSDWCVPCIRMKKDVFETNLFQNFANEKLVLVRADFPRLSKNKLSAQQTEHNEALAEKYNPEGKFPFTLLIDSNGKVIKAWDGYTNTSPEDFIAQINKITNAQ
ncbi:MAG: thioredoxin family protein [Flectobacillus sp.]|uniref:thioredoxin family protein n=1 Tax=Flectobacillus sp. TaxID=50419 RepID=UPI003B992887